MKITSWAGYEFKMAHFQGGSYPLYRWFTRYWENNPVAVSPDITIITCFNNYERAILARQLAGNHIPFIGQSIKGAWNNVMKIGLIVKGLLETKTKHVVIADANDVLLTQDILELPDIAGAVYNATKNNYPAQVIDHPHSEGLFAYFNAGLCLAETKFALDFYRHCQDITHTIHNPLDSEQLIVRTACADYRDHIRIDWKGEYFQTFSCTHVEKRGEDYAIV